VQGLESDGILGEMYSKSYGADEIGAYWRVLMVGGIVAVDVVVVIASTADAQ
jgi:hypothetical protein